MSQFDRHAPEVPLVPGRLRGHRVFCVESDGTLTGVSFQAPWAAGDNDAMCGIRNATEWSSHYYSPMGIFSHLPHSIASKDCTCGFYAFFAKQRNE